MIGSKWKWSLGFLLGILYLTLMVDTQRQGRIVQRRKRTMHRLSRDNLKPKICFEFVGCFVDSPQHLSLKRPPEHPNVINTRFLLYTRTGKEMPEVIEYGDSFRSIIGSKFDFEKQLKVIVHGYKGSGNDEGAIFGARSFLALEDANVIILDWTRGAGTTYQAAVANTELVGRQLALILLDVIKLGVNPVNIHIIGFSLGAHVAGCASEVLKKRNLLLGRITGLDPASPFFKNHLVRDRSRKLDVSDARLVDVIHTDGSEVFTDGFGLLKPIGHIDFFPNGGIEQPGCIDVKNSVVVSHFNEESLNRKIACSHIRAWKYFVESMHTQFQNCKFTSWTCKRGASSFKKGLCFPRAVTNGPQEMGYAADRGPSGVFYLVTRPEEPFCGDPLRAVVTTSEVATKTLGILYINIEHQNSTTNFKISCDLSNPTKERTTFYGIAATKFQSLPENVKVIRGAISYRAAIESTEENTTFEPKSIILPINKIAIEDRKGNRWEYCKKETVMLVDWEDSHFELYNKPCTN
ncbi:pancreatic triacylglycerol lipase isoform X2 [Cephus cinctus]|nr:pancreatic triacylglycerol lipase isoform X2 [Cephus cinctus]XP_024939390.1 pancreatic triacylglycerol lipase isoform X2 [Cephus cinctus]